VVRGTGQNGPLRRPTLRAVDACVTLVASEQLVELDHVLQAHGVGVGEDEQGLGLEILATSADPSSSWLSSSPILHTSASHFTSG
jgi:hypothetical protein